MSALTPNMSLVQPTIGIDSGLTWEQSANANSAILDGHNHTPGYGVQIPSAGLNINSALTFNNQQAIALQGAVFIKQSSLSTLLALFVGADGNLYFNDGAGDPSIQITASGSVNATSSGIASGTATAGFVTNVLTVLSAANTPANIQGASLLLGNTVANSKYLTLSPPSSMAANYDLTLPTIPSVTSVMTIDTSGNMAGSLTVDNSTIVISGGVIQVPSGGITQTQLNASIVFVPSGIISAFGGTSAPSGYLLCDGTSYANASYPALFTAIGTAYGTADGTHFNVPDLRGQFLRGVTGLSANDPDASSRTAMNTGGNTGNNVGSIQGGQVVAHVHAQEVPTSTGGSGHSANGTLIPSSPTPSGLNTGSYGGNETRPINAYVNYIIKT